MLTATPIDAQIDALGRDQLKVLVVGAGVAGTALAQLLRGRGLHPVLIERAGREGSPGYMLALMPMVDQLMEDLEVRAAYLARSTAMERYLLRSHTGQVLRLDRLAELMARYGDCRGISRGELLDVLSSAGGAVSYETTVSAIRQDDDTVTATLASPSGEREVVLDLLVAADGLHSQIRGLILDATEIETIDTGWGGWVAWADADSETDLGEEVWGADFFIGSYPVLGQLGIILCGPEDLMRRGPAAVVSHVRNQMTHPGGRVETVLDAVANADHPYYWALTDCRANRWSAGRVSLLGDAAAGFLPTAGIGAGMALESTSVLANELAEIDAHAVPQALRRFESRQRRRVEVAQDNSRLLARLILRRSRLLAIVRDLIMSRVSAKVVLGPIQKLLATTSATPGATPANQAVATSASTRAT